MVPKDWVHPSYEGGRLIGLFDSDFKECAADWDKDCAEWNAGNFPSYACDDSKKLSYLEWCGERPSKEDYMPTWKKEEKTHLMMYETTSEGTPISPAFETPEELARWLTDNEASALGGNKGTYDGWLRVAKGGYAPSIIMSSKGIESGVNGMLK